MSSENKVVVVTPEKLAERFRGYPENVKVILPEILRRGGIKKEIS